MASDFETQARAANDKINARTGRPLLRAIGVGLLLGGSLLVSLLIIKELYMVFAGALVAFVAYELATALRAAGRDVPRVPTLIAAVAVVPATFYWLDDGHWWVTLGGIAVISIWRLVELVRPSARATP